VTKLLDADPGKALSAGVGAGDACGRLMPWYEAGKGQALRDFAGSTAASRAGRVARVLASSSRGKLSRNMRDAPKGAVS
jgi:hypothetical protein